MRASREDILGQLLMLRLEESGWNASTERLLRATVPAGVLLAPPLPRTPEATAELLCKISRALPVVPYLAIEEEGGAVDPLRAFFPPLPSPRGAAQKSPSAVARLGELAGRALKLLGFNTNFAPVLDLAAPFSEKTLGTRTFSNEPLQVAQCGMAFVRGLERHRILACGKHFPGLGSVSTNVGAQLPICAMPMAGLWREDLVPFRALLPRLPLVALSAGVYKAYDFDPPRPAMHSRAITEGLLRVKLEYQGIAVANLLELDDHQGKADSADAAVKSLNAGCDLMIVRGNESCEVTLRALKAGIDSRRISHQRVEQALERIRRAKKALVPSVAKVRETALNELVQRFADFSKQFHAEELRIA